MKMKNPNENKKFKFYLLGNLFNKKNKNNLIHQVTEKEKQNKNLKLQICLKIKQKKNLYLADQSNYKQFKEF